MKLLETVRAEGQLCVKSMQSMYDGTVVPE